MSKIMNKIYACLDPYGRIGHHHVARTVGAALPDLVQPFVRLTHGQCVDHGVALAAGRARHLD